MLLKEFKNCEQFIDADIVIYYDRNGNMLPEEKIDSRKLNRKEVISSVPLKALMVDLDI